MFNRLAKHSPTLSHTRFICLLFIICCSLLYRFVHFFCYLRCSVDSIQYEKNDETAKFKSKRLFLVIRTDNIQHGTVNRFDAFSFVSFNINTNRTRSRLVWTQARAAEETRCLTDHVKIEKKTAWNFNNYWSAVISVQINRFPIFVRLQKKILLLYT